MVRKLSDEKSFAGELILVSYDKLLTDTLHALFSSASIILYIAIFRLIFMTSYDKLIVGKIFCLLLLTSYDTLSIDTILRANEIITATIYYNNNTVDNINDTLMESIQNIIKTIRNDNINTNSTILSIKYSISYDNPLIKTLSGLLFNIFCIVIFCLLLLASDKLSIDLILGTNDIVITTLHYNNNNKIFDDINTLIKSIQIVAKTNESVLIRPKTFINNEILDELYQLPVSKTMKNITKIDGNDNYNNKLFPSTYIPTTSPRHTHTHEAPEHTYTPKPQSRHTHILKPPSIHTHIPKPSPFYTIEYDGICEFI